MIYESQNIDYSLFLIREAYNQRQMDLWIQEALMWASDTVTAEKLDSLNESIKDTAKEKFTKLWETIKKAFRKVYHGIANFMKKDETFLEDNKDIIIGKKVTFTEDIDLYPYDEGIKRMKAYPVPEFNYDQIKQISTDDGDFQKVLTDYFKIGSKITANKDDLREKCEDFFRGGPEKTYKASELNMTNIYNVCVDYKKSIKESLDKDVAVIEKTDEKMKLAIDKVKLTESSAFDDNPIVYSNFFESYMFLNEFRKNSFKNYGRATSANEAGEGNQSNGNSGSSQPSGSQPSSNNNSNNSGSNSGSSAEKESNGTSNKTNNTAVTKPGEAVKQSSMDKGKVNTASSDQIEKDINGNKEEYDKLIAQCDLYTSIASAIAQAKVTVFSEMYKTYMDIIHKHYNTYSGQAKDDKEGNRAKSAATDYNNNLTPEAEKALENQKVIKSVDIRAKANNAKNTDPNGYIIKIVYTDPDSQEEAETYQDVSSIYPANTDGAEFIAGTAKIIKKDGIYKLARSYNVNGQRKTRGVNIVPLGKSNAGPNGYVEANATNKTQ